MTTKSPKENSATDSEQNSIHEILQRIRKDRPDESVLIMSDEPDKDVSSVSTGSIGLDYALGTGGFPMGRVVEIYGPEATGKTTLALHAIANAQRPDKDGKSHVCGFIDMEHALDRNYAERLGVDANSMLFSQPDCAEDAFELAETMIRNQVRVVVIDSVSALVPRAELEGSIEDHQVAMQARLMSKGLRKLTGINSAENSLIIFINQLRYKIGGYGNPETTSGGNALKFYSSVRIDMRTKDRIKSSKGDEVIGTNSQAKVVKNKLAPPSRMAKFQIIFGRGINQNQEIIQLGSEFNIIQKSGAWFSYGDQRIGHGQAQAEEYLMTNPQIMAEIRDQVMTQLWTPHA